MNDLSNPTFGQAALIAILGLCFVFLALLFLMAILYVSAAIFSSKEKKVKAAVATPAPAAPAPVETEAPKAPGSCGDLKLYDTPVRDAAMVMAIVADKTETPLNQLRFKSIRRVDSAAQKKGGNK